MSHIDNILLQSTAPGALLVEKEVSELQESGADIRDYALHISDTVKRIPNIAYLWPTPFSEIPIVFDPRVPGDSFKLMFTGSQEAEAGHLSPSEAVYGVMTWLSAADPGFMVGSHHDATILARIANEFCKINGLREPGDSFPDNLASLPPLDPDII